MPSNQPSSTSPSGESFQLPAGSDYTNELTRIEQLVHQSRSEQKEIVVVMGLGFVGAVMAAIVADTKGADGKNSKFVIGCQRPSPRSYWKIPLINRGEAPVKAEDPEVDVLIRRCVVESKTLTATYNSDVLQFADCVVVDVQCDFAKKELGNMRSGEADMAALEDTMRTIGEKIQPECLVLIETTVAPETTDDGRQTTDDRHRSSVIRHRSSVIRHRSSVIRHFYVASIRDFWRVCSGCEPVARARVEQFLHEVLNTKDFPLTVMDRPIESETTKIVENSYRATILAYLNEWSLFAERNGVDLIKVIDAIKMRPTHSNMIFPGPGIGGYCLPKDGGLGYWALRY